MGSTVQRHARRILAGVFTVPVLVAAFLPAPVFATTSPSWAASVAPTAGLSPAPGVSVDDGANLGPVACPAVGSCVAVGNYWDSSSHVQGLIETLSGGSWAATTAPVAGLNPAPGADPQIHLVALSCPAPGSCVAVGNYMYSGAGLIETLSNGSWAATTAPAPAAGHSVVLSAISCASTNSCVAVGEYYDASGSHGLIETLSNDTWTAATVPTSGLGSAAADVIIRTVSCPASDSCVATGSYVDSSLHHQALIATLAAGTWSAITAPVSGLSPAPALNPLMSLSSLSCPGAGSCFVVGSYQDALGQQDGLIESLTGGTWTAATAPTTGLSPARGPHLGDSVNLNSLSCSAVGSCVGVGQYGDTSNNLDGLAETLTGDTWSAATVPTAGLIPEARYVNSITNVSCPAAGSCTAVGTYQDVSGIEHAMTETQSGGIWTAATAPVGGLNPPPIYSTDPLQATGIVPETLSGVTCPASGSCVAVGRYQDLGQILHGLVETLSSAPTSPPGYWLSTTAGNVYNFHAPSYLPAASAGQIAGIAADGPGYLLTSSSGRVSSYNAPSFGSFSGTLPAPVAGIATDKATGGYWLTTRAGNVYNFGAPWYGSMAGRKIPAPVIGIGADRSGYLLATRAGNVYNFGTPWYGSMAGKQLPAPVVGITADPATGGYWLTTSAGNVYGFNAPWYGSLAGQKLPSPIVGIAANGAGYLLVSAAGHVYAFNTPGYGSLPGKPPAPVVGITVAG